MNKEITEKELEIDLVKYFNSLNHIDMSDEKNKHYSSAIVTKINQNKTTTLFKGQVKIFDRFATNKMITLHVKIESYYCNKKQKTNLLFRFSPKEFNHQTWKMLQKVKLHTYLCD